MNAIAAFDHGTGVTVTNASLWNNKGVAYLALNRYQDAWEVFNKALGIDPNYTEAQANLAIATSGNGQVVQINGTITPEVTISRIGTLFTTVTPTPVVTEVITEVPGTARSVHRLKRLLPLPGRQRIRRYLPSWRSGVSSGG